MGTGKQERANDWSRRLGEMGGKDTVEKEGLGKQGKGGERRRLCRANTHLVLEYIIYYAFVIDQLLRLVE